MIFVDSNVLIDVILGKDAHAAWSASRLAEAEPPLVINEIVVAEVAPRFIDLAHLLDFMIKLGVEVMKLPLEAAFIAGQAHAAYRARGGTRHSIVADFLIAGHATTLDATLLTRDRRRFATYFPTLSLITPETHPND